MKPTYLGDNLVVCGDVSGTTGLTETQARALADWWGGSYQQVVSPEGSGAARHGVIFTASGGQDPDMPVSPETVIFSLEEAQNLEKFRDVVNPGAPDWVG
jgi:hypothetical protein